MPVSSGRLVARLGERGGFGFLFYPGRERMGGGSRLAVPVAGACLPSLLFER